MTIRNIRSLYDEAKSFLHGPDHDLEFSLNKISKVLSPEDRKKLKRLLITYLDIAASIAEDKLRLKVDNVTDVSNDYEIQRLVHLTESLDWAISNIVPTYDHAISLVGITHKAYDSLNNVIIGNRTVSRNRVVSRWSREKFVGAFMEYSSFTEEAKIIVYSPEAYIEKNGISILVGSWQDIEEVIQKFKRDLRNEFVPNRESPIMSTIDELLERGNKLLEQDKRKMEKRKMLDSTKRFKRDHIGKEF